MARHTTSPWLEDSPLPRPPHLEGGAETDVCVVGAGIAGLATAYRLASEGLRVIVLEKGKVGEGQTGRTTAHLSDVLDDRFQRVEEMHGVEGSRLAAESHRVAIEDFEETARREGIGGFERVDGYLFLGGGKDRSFLEAEAEAARRAGLAPELLAKAPVEGFESGPCLRFEGQAQLRPLAFLAGLCRGIEAAGGRIYGDTRVVSLDEEDGRPVVTGADGSEVRCRDVVLATNSPVGRHLAQLQMVPHRTYAMTFRVPAGGVSRALYWDVDEPYHYVRLHRDERSDLLMVGGGDHPTGSAPDGDPHDALEAWTRSRFPAVGEVVHRWSGQVLEPADGLAYCGQAPSQEHVWFHTGDSGQGMTHGMMAARLLADLLQGRPNRWAELYAPSRLGLRAMGGVLEGAAEAARSFLVDLLSGDEGRVEDIPPGQGAVVKRGRHRLAVYRDPSGALHERSAVCTHQGCVVVWNADDPGWDCPCHGSRFDPMGQVVTGPAAEDLGEAERPIREGEARRRTPAG